MPRRWRWSGSRATRSASPASFPAGSASASPWPAPSSTGRAVLLLDEPLGALDLKLREQMQIELKHIQQEVGITFIYVTHDQEEALTMSDRLAVFNRGRIEQIGTPAEVYEHPATPFVAGFVGTSNLLKDDAARAVIGRDGMFTVRPEKIQIGEPATSRRPTSIPRSGRCAKSSTSARTPDISLRLMRAANSSSPSRTCRPRRWKPLPRRAGRSG